MGRLPRDPAGSLGDVAASLLTLLDGPDGDFFKDVVRKTTGPLVEMMSQAAEAQVADVEREDFAEDSDRRNGAHSSFAAGHSGIGTELAT